MVSLPVSRQTKSSTNARSCSSDSPVLRSARISTIIGTITFIQPDRINDNVPSKSKSTTRAFRAEAPGRMFSSIQVYSKKFDRRLRYQQRCCGCPGSYEPPNDGNIPQQRTFCQDGEG